ncbi:MAG: cobalamin-binding protein [Deltaproteobacteria bacterium]|nr:cobalamin-binding protein [Deltaproteobacteria bacterium]
MKRRLGVGRPAVAGGCGASGLDAALWRCGLTQRASEGRLPKFVFMFLAVIPLDVSAGVLAWLPPAGEPKAPPARIVSLAPSITEMLFEIGAGGRVVGVTRYDDWPPEAKKVRQIGGYLDVDIETVMLLKPDAVFCEPNAGIKNVVERLAGAGIPVGVVTVAEVASIFLAIEELGRAVGHEEKAKATAAGLRTRLDALKKRIEGTAPATVLLFFNVSPLMAAGKGAFADEALRLAGGKNLAGESPVMYPVYDVEKVAALDPAVIVDQSEATMGATGLSGDSAAFWKKWPNLKAVKTRRVHTVPGVYLFRPGPRIVESIEKLARTLHPEAF